MTSAFRYEQLKIKKELPPLSLEGSGRDLGRGRLRIWFEIYNIMTDMSIIFLGGHAGNGHRPLEYKKDAWGAPGWLSRVIVRLQLRSRSRGP